MARVLIVDDHEEIVELVQLNLELDGHEVLVAYDGESALAQVRAQRPDVVLLDVMMPRLDGWGVLASVKADPDPALQTIPVVMLTALGDEQDRVRGGIEGAVHYLTKPVTPDEVLEAVRHALEDGPEPAQRRRAQEQALARLARLEAGAPGDAPEVPQPRLTRLERTPAPGPAAAPPAPSTVTIALSDSQRHLLRALRAHPSVSDTAEALGMSRSNIYASLRRIGRKLDEHDATAILRRLRSGELDHLLA